MQLLENAGKKKLRVLVGWFSYRLQETKSLKRLTNNAKNSIADLPCVYLSGIADL